MSAELLPVVDDAHEADRSTGTVSGFDAAIVKG